MNKLSRYMQNYLVYGFPFIIAIGFGLYFFPLSNASNYIIIRIINRLLGYNFMLWFATLVLYMIFLVVIPSIRDKKLRRLANLQERDEREVYITGKAARSSYIATLSLSLFLLFFSLINIKIVKSYQMNSQKPHYILAMSAHYSVFNKIPVEKFTDDPAKTIFELSNFMPSCSTIILVLLGWQLLVFNLVARKERLRDL